jgi:hypothetical protein
MEATIEQTHTPTPWSHMAIDSGDVVITAAGSFLATCHEPAYGEMQGNAAHIVRCVNAHDSLVFALRVMLDDCNIHGEPLARTREIARAALAKVSA